MRSLSSVITDISGLLPDPSTLTGQVAVNIAGLKAELAVMSRQASYMPPEGADALWTNLGMLLYRYMPPPNSQEFTWAGQISVVVLGA